MSTPCMLRAGVSCCRMAEIPIWSTSLYGEAGSGKASLVCFPGQLQLQYIAYKHLQWLGSYIKATHPLGAGL